VTIRGDNRFPIARALLHILILIPLGLPYLIVTSTAFGSDHAADHYVRGLKLADDGNVDEAIQELVTATRLDSTSIDLSKELARLLVQSRRFEEAIPIAEKAAALSPADPENLWILGQAYQQMRRLDDAIRVFRKAVDLDGGRNRNYVVALLLAYDLTDRPAEALRLLRPQEGGVEPDSPFLLFRRGDLEDHLGEVKPALDDYLSAMREAPGYPGVLERFLDLCRRAGPSDTTVAACQEGLAIQPDRIELRRALAQILVSLGREGDAIPQMEALLAADSSDAGVTIQLGIARLHQGELPQAVSLIRKAIEIYPELPDANAWLWRSLDAADSLDAALALCDRWRADAPEDLHVRWYRGVSLMRLRRFDEAMVELDGYISRVPDSREALLLSAMVLSLQDKPEEARARIRTILATSPNDRDALYRLAQIEQRAGDSHAALALLRGLIQSDPEDAASLNDAGYLCAELDTDLTTALDWTSRAVKLEGTNGVYRDSRGWVLYRMGKLDDAIRELKLAAEQAPGQPEIGIHLAHALHAAGRLREAREILEGLLKEQPDGTEARRLLESWEKVRGDSGGNFK
jgi:tetratricopeptide (TPR) repeat protein